MSDQPLALPPPEDAREGEYIRAGSIGLGTLETEHSDERAAVEQRGDPATVNVEEMTTAWVLQRLHKEATDFGARTRQSSRVKALELIGKHLAMFTEVVEHRDPVREALKDLSPWERKKRILELASRMASDPAFAASVQAEAAKVEK